MNFDLIDQVLEKDEDRIVVLKQVSRAEEYLADHFPEYPVLPGVMMVETMAQAAQRLLADRTDERLVLGEVRALKFGSMVRPGEALEVEVSIQDDLPDGRFACRGVGRVRRLAPPDSNSEVPADRDSVAASGRFTMRPVSKQPSNPSTA